jgi:hypothetical protein
MYIISIFCWTFCKLYIQSTRLKWFGLISSIKAYRCGPRSGNMDVSCLPTGWHHRQLGLTWVKCVILLSA